MHKRSEFLQGPVTYTILACVLCLFFLFCNAFLFVPAHPGVDQNAYLVGGKLLAQNGSLAYRTENPATGEQDPFQFIGQMWVGYDLNTAEQRYYPKYPIGLPVMVATIFKLAGPDQGTWFAYWISPFCMSLALLAVFFLTRLVAHPLLALLSSTFLFGSPIILNLSSNPNSHAASLMCLAWGMYFLFSWWQRQGFARAGAAGFLLGYAATIRYTDGLFLLPLLLVVMMNITAGNKPARPWLQSAILLLAWASPVVVLFTHNILAFGSLTGYGATNESTGFALIYFVNNWDTMLRQISNNAMVFMFPFALAGLIAMFWWSWRFALVLTTWIVPTTLVYTAFYWAPDSIDYARYFLSIVPALTMCAFWFLNQAVPPSALSGRPGLGSEPFPTPNPVLAAPTRVVAIVMTLLTVAVGITQTAPRVYGDYYYRNTIDGISRMTREMAAPGSVIVSDDTHVLHHLQFAADYQLYNLETFKQARIRNLPVSDPGPVRFNRPEITQAHYENLKNMSQHDLDEALHDIFRKALDHGQDVFVIKREDNPAHRSLKHISNSTSRKKPSSKPISDPGVTAPPSPTPLLSPSIAPPEEFSTRIADTLSPPTPSASSHFAGQPKENTTPDPLVWQLIQVTKKPDSGQ